jgi:cbb3-type cytochrome oxidase maturation protein
VDSLYILVPIALVFLAIAIKLFFWAVDSGQYDDIEQEGSRLLFDEDEPSAAVSKSPEHSTEEKHD